MRVKDAFIDVTSGNNNSCGFPGYNATAGWDPVTGAGIMNWAVLKELWTQEHMDFSQDKVDFLRLKAKYHKHYASGEERSRYTA